MKRDIQLQKLLLLAARDGEDLPELGKYSVSERVHNSALLIDSGYVKGQTVQNGSGITVSTIMTEITSKGHDFLEEAENHTSFKVQSATPPQPQLNMPQVNSPAIMSQLIFISHSNTDKDIAEALIDLLATALNLRFSNFLCTSVEGAKLRGGDQTGAVLRQAISNLPVFLSILTQKAVTSTYVLFELGARWGTGKPHIPLLARGAGADLLKEPLKDTNALQLGNEAGVLQLVYELGEMLRLSPEPPHVFLKKMVHLVALSNVKNVPDTKVSPELEGQTPSVIGKRSVFSLSGPEPIFSKLSDAAKRFLIEASGSVDGNVSKVRSSSYGEIVHAHTGKQEFLGDITDNRSRALWVHAFNELVSAGCLKNLPGSAEVFSITHVGYELADKLKNKT